MSRRRSLAVLLALVVAGCGSSGGAVEIPSDQLPAALRGTGDAPDPGGARSVTVHFVRERRLVPTRQVVAGDVSGVEAALSALLRGPDADHRAEGVATMIPPQTRLLEVVVFDQVADVDLSAEFQSPAESEDVLLRVAQVVWTVVGLPGVTAVRFLVDGESIGVVTDRGVTVTRPVAAPDYGAVAPVQTPSAPPSG